MKTKYFSGTTEGKGLQPMDNARFKALFGDAKGRRCDSFSMYVTFDDTGKPMPVTRTIFRKANPSNHKCDSRCRSAKGHNCECSCGGKFHGAEG